MKESTPLLEENAAATKDKETLLSGPDFTFSKSIEPDLESYPEALATFKVIWNDFNLRALCLAILICVVLTFVLAVCIVTNNQVENAAEFNALCILVAAAGVCSGISLLKSIWLMHSGKRRYYLVRSNIFEA